MRYSILVPPGEVSDIRATGGSPFPVSAIASVTHETPSTAPGRYSDRQPWNSVSDECKDFVKKCLLKNPEERLTAEQAQGHPWIVKAVQEAKGEPLSKGSMMAMMRFQESNMLQRYASFTFLARESELNLIAAPVVP